MTVYIHMNTSTLNDLFEHHKTIQKLLNLIITHKECIEDQAHCTYCKQQQPIDEHCPTKMAHFALQCTRKSTI